MSAIGPPRLAEWLLEALVGPGPVGQSIVGDAREEYAQRRARAGARATLWYWWYVVALTASYGWPPGPTILRRVGAWNFRQSARALARRPTFTLAIIGTLGFSIGSFTLAFALIEGVLLRPLPYPNSDRLVDVSRVNPDWFGGPPNARQAANVFATPPATYLDWEAQAASFDALGAYAPTTGVLGGGDAPERFSGARVTAGTFTALGIAPLLGRARQGSDDRVGAPRVVMLGYDLYRDRFGADLSTIGTTVSIDGSPHTVIGVMPPGFAFPYERTRFWIGLTDEDLVEQRRNAGWLHAVGRLADGATLASAREEMSAVQTRLAEVHPDEGLFIVAVHSSHAIEVASYRRGLLLLLGAAVIVLLVACANIAGLFVARMAERRRELTVHAALGAGGAALARIVAGEVALLASAGGALGATLAYLGMDEFVRVFPESIPRATEVGINPVVLAATLGITGLVALALSIAPVVMSRRVNFARVLREGGQGSTLGRAGGRTQGMLVFVEVALAVVLLATAGLFFQSHVRVNERSRGFDAENRLLTRVSIPEDRRASPETVVSFFDELERELRALPGVERVASASQMPYVGGYSTPPAKVELGDGEELVALNESAVSTGYFDAMGIPLLAGRQLDEHDATGSAPVTVVSQALADQLWPGLDPLGRRIRLDDGEEPWREVVGVVGSIRWRFASDEAAQYYRPMKQAPAWSRGIVVQARSGWARELSPRIAAVIRAAEPRVPITVRPLSDWMADDPAFRSSRTGTVVMTVLSGVATLLSLLGVYGVLAFGVVRRQREIGIRVSLGGRVRDVLMPIMRRTLSMTGLGLLAGLAGSIWVSSALQASTPEVATLNPGVLAGVIAVVIFTTLLASLIPSIRAMRVDPLITLRTE